MAFTNLAELQKLSLEDKVDFAITRIVEWHDWWRGKVAVSFSGGKDSTVLLDLVRSVYPHIPAVFVDTGLEYPEVREFVKTVKNVTWLKPEMNFRKVIEIYGYPVTTKKNASFLHELHHAKPGSGTYWHRYLGLTKNGERTKHCLAQKWKYLLRAPFRVSDRCCKIMKVNPLVSYQEQTGTYPYVGTMASDSRTRRVNYSRFGCNAFEARTKVSRPLSIWLDTDIWEYFKVTGIPYSRIYDMGEERTGCMFCMFGVHLEKEPNRFQRMRISHPKQWAYCIYNLGIGQVLDYIDVPYE